MPLHISQHGSRLEENGEDSKNSNLSSILTDVKDKKPMETNQGDFAEVKLKNSENEVLISTTENRVATMEAAEQGAEKLAQEDKVVLPDVTPAPEPVFSCTDWNSIPTLKEFYEQRGETVPKGCLSFFSQVALWSGDITKLRIDAIVNAANSSLLGGGGVDGAIHRAAGPDLKAECRTLNGCKTGEAKISGSHKMIWIKSPMVGYYSRVRLSDDYELISCYQSSMKLLVANGLKTIAFPCISTGIYGYPNDRAAWKVVSFLYEFFSGDGAADIERVVVVTFLEKDRDAYTAMIDKYLRHFQRKENEKNLSLDNAEQSTMVSQEQKLQTPQKNEEKEQDKRGDQKRKEVGKKGSGDVNNYEKPQEGRKEGQSSGVAMGKRQRDKTLTPAKLIPKLSKTEYTPEKQPQKMDERDIKTEQDKVPEELKSIVVKEKKEHTEDDAAHGGERRGLLDVILSFLSPLFRCFIWLTGARRRIDAAEAVRQGEHCEVNPLSPPV